MVDFHATKMGLRFFESTMPRIATALEKLVQIQTQSESESEKSDRGYYRIIKDGSLRTVRWWDKEGISEMKGLTPRRARMVQDLLEKLQYKLEPEDG